MRNRVVITGLGVVSPNGVGIPDFLEAIKTGRSGITYHQELADLKFACQIGGIPPVTEAHKRQYFSELQLQQLNSSGIVYGVIAGMEAWKNAGLPVADDEPDWESGIVFGTGILGIDKLREAIYKVDQGQVRRLGSTVVVQTMTSGVSAYLAGMLGCGNQISTNSSACATGTEALLIAYDRIASGQAKRMLAGSCNDHGPYIWGGFDAMRVLPYQFNQTPEQASRPMSATARGFVPASGAGALTLESLESALARNATIYAEVLGGHVNSGGQRGGGTLTAPNSVAVSRCIQQALQQAQLPPSAVDLIDGHLTATSKDPDEVSAWCDALGRRGNDFPYINSLKSMVGHCLSAAGSVECVASVLELHHGFIYPSINSETIHPEIASLIDSDKIPQQLIQKDIQVIAKANFGFGDVNACAILKKFNLE
ncbi:MULTISPECIES: beta-ketoacyl synthase [unclassified Spirosoma]|uniref:beta-ketoacyl-[acyl-carrier-protein] synthase family protein n=1 Tax=unclassified Spirosoma TaxID=2621999 RepID=UPI00095B1A96|nr:MULTISPECIES: beta-ketoacyl-[acyl-carrier-protein] synthase family protein [unclassified Spirosoma]MBN8823052.1 beta-ketoacyl-[acyl-carrier-protein] synthase family protein [Spirosoma sp.]OJW73151.1 MAG: beta-ketoacyl-ACP synthase [Spirosoma sp. 48-14]